MSDPLMQRNVQGRARRRPLVVKCPIRGCDGTMYRVRPGEHLSRVPRPGWRTVSRACRCDSCAHEQTLRVQVPASEEE